MKDKVSLLNDFRQHAEEKYSALPKWLDYKEKAKRINNYVLEYKDNLVSRLDTKMDNLTAREAARLQTFPDDFIFQGYKTRMSWQKSLSQFEQIGNAVPPRLAELIGECLIKMLEGKSPKASIEYEPIYEQMTLDLGIIQEPETKKHQARGKTHSNRGRNSKYSAIYTAIEGMPDGEILLLPDNIDEDFFTFVKGAMRRRNIDYEISEENGKKIFVRKGLKKGI